MSRYNYSEDNDDPLAEARWFGALKRALQGRRGQALLRELVEVLDSMDDKRLYPRKFMTGDGKFCALGVLGAKRGIRMDDLGDADRCDIKKIAQRFDIAPAMAAEIMYMNDEYVADEWAWVEVEICGPMRQRSPERGKHKRLVCVPNENHPRERWEGMRAWAVEQLKGKTQRW